MDEEPGGHTRRGEENAQVAKAEQGSSSWPPVVTVTDTAPHGGSRGLVLDDDVSGGGWPRGGRGGHAVSRLHDTAGSATLAVAAAGEGEGTPSSGEHRNRGGEAASRLAVHDLLENPESSLAARFIHYFIVFVILASTGCVIVETVPEMSANPIFFPIEMCITALFTVEFVLRFYACDSMKEFMSNYFNVIDFLAIFPGYVDLMILLLRANEDHVHSATYSIRTLRMIRIIRLVRVFRVMRLAKVARHSQMLSLVVAVVIKVAQSGLVVVVLLMGFAMVLSASLIYLTESSLCEESGLYCTGPSAFESIPASFWWAITTLTTVGYGDMVPHSSAGRVIGGITAVVGVMIVAIGVALVSINFHECFNEEKAKADNKRRGQLLSRTETREQDRSELEELLQSFESSSSVLVGKLRALSGQQDEASFQQLSTMLDMLASHRSMLTSDVKVFMDSVLRLNDMPMPPTDTLL